MIDLKAFENQLDLAMAAQKDVTAKPADMPVPSRPGPDAIATAERCLKSLKSSRADDYQQWIEVGMALHSAGCNVSDWDDWSKTSGKYEPGLCQEKWQTFKNDNGLTVASLIHWAQQDDPKFDATAEKKNSKEVKKPDRMEDAAKQAKLKITCCADIEPRITEWLIPEIMPLSCITAVVSQEGDGKSTIAAYWAAGVSCGGGNVVLFNHEEDPHCTIVPRLIANGADLSKIFLIDGVLTTDGENTFDIERNMPLLYAWVEKSPGLKMVIFDPAPSFISCNENSNQDVRRALKQLVNFATERKVSILLLSHLNKKVDLGMINRTIGSRAWSAVPRLSWGIHVEQSEDEEGNKKDTGGRFLLSIKCNIGRKPRGFKFTIGEGGRVTVDDDRVDISIDAPAADGGMEASRKGEILDWIVMRLGKDSVPQKEIAAEAYKKWNIGGKRLGDIATKGGIHKRFSAAQNCWVWNAKRP